MIRGGRGSHLNHETLPTIDHSTLTLKHTHDTPNTHKGRFAFLTVNRKDSRSNGSLLHYPIQLQGQPHPQHTYNRTFEHSRRVHSLAKHITKSPVKVLESICSDPKLETLRGNNRLTNPNNKDQSSIISIRSRKFVSSKEKSEISRAESPYLFSYTERPQSKRTPNPKKTTSKNLSRNPRFRADKYSVTNVPRLDSEKEEEQMQLPLNLSINIINEDMENVLTEYLNDQPVSHIKSKYDIEMYINTVRAPVSTSVSANEDISRPHYLSAHKMHYDFDFEEEKRADAQKKDSFRSKAYGNSSKLIRDKRNRP